MNSIVSYKKYRITEYQKISLKNEESDKQKDVLEGIILNSRGLSGNKTYFECSSARLHNI